MSTAVGLVEETLGLEEVDITVQVFVVNEKDEALMVDEKGDGDVLTNGVAKYKGKPPGWGLPGGNILTVNQRTAKTFLASELLRECYDQIVRFVGVFGIDIEAFQDVVSAKNLFPETSLGALFALTAVREVLEETGLLVQPIMILSEDRVGEARHRVVTVFARYVDGEIVKRTTETKDCKWTALDRLPVDTYVSHERRIISALATLGVKVTVKRDIKDVPLE